MKGLLGMLIFVGTALPASQVHAEPSGKPPMSMSASAIDRDFQQCAEAETPAVCRAAAAACDHAISALAQQPSTPAIDARLASSLRRAARCKNELGEPAAAAVLFRRALALQQKLHGASHVEVAQELSNLSQTLIGLGQFDQAEALSRQALSMHQKLLGPENLEVAENVHGLALVFLEQGKYDQAESLLRQSQAMLQRLLGRRHPRSALCLTDLAYVLGEKAQYQEAESLFRESLQILRTSPEGEDRGGAQALNNLALVLKRQGKFDQAEPMYRQALTLLFRQYGDEHPHIAATLSNLAGVLGSQGKYEQAEVMFRRAIAMLQKVRGPDHPDTAAALNNLGLVFLRQEKYQPAEPILRQVLGLVRKQLGSEHPNLATIDSNLALALWGQGKYEEAELLQRQSLALRQKLLGAEHPDIATNLNALAIIYRSRGQFAQAEVMHRQALAIKHKRLGGEHPQVAQILHNLAEVLVAQERLADALGYFQQAAEAREHGLRAAVSETRMLAALDMVRSEEDAVYGLLLAHPDHPQLQRLALANALLRKGRAAEAGGLANQVVHQHLADPMLHELFEKWQSLRQKREQLLFGGPGKLAPDAYRDQLATLAREADDLEGQLALGLPELRTQTPPLLGEVIAAVAAQLPPRGVLMEVIHTRPLNFRATGAEPRWGQAHYLAMTLSASQSITVYDLGMAEQVESRIQELLSALRNPASDPVPVAYAVYSQLLAPLFPRGTEHLYLSLDAALNMVPFDALHDGKDYLAGRVSFHYLTSGRDLLRPEGPNKSQPALVLADPDFFSVSADPAAAGQLAGDAARDASGEAKPVAPSRSDSDSGSFYSRLVALPRLAGAQKEALAIARFLSVQPLLGAAATETVIRDARAPWLLHIASHGLFLHDQAAPTDPQGSARGLDWLQQGQRKLLAGVSPNRPLPALSVGSGQGALSRSALVLAGAAKGQSAASAAHDGLLTAEESRSLDLLGTQLVVLSACETGQGDLSVGQGVFGLRRAFLVAGAETLVTSLWQVNDEATGKLMRIYYRRLLRQKQGRLRAMQEAMKDMRKQFRHPYYWAPFLVIGNDKPLRVPPPQ